MNWDPHLPLYKQIQEQIKASILRGEFKEGDLLPSVRKMALDLNVNPLTINRVYRNLTDEGWVVAQRGLGMKVVIHASTQLQIEQKLFLEKEWPVILEKIARLKLSPKDILGKC